MSRCLRRKIVANRNRIPETIVVTMRPFRRAFIGCLASASLSFTKGMPINVAKIPKARAISGKTKKIRLPVAMLIKPPIIIPPMFSPVADSKRSAPLPAESPTLSPTLSAITAGLRGSSSGMPASTLPTKSAPTSAALV